MISPINIAMRQWAEAKRNQELEEAQAKEEYQKSQILFWCGSKGTDSQKERLEAGYLPLEEALETLQDYLFDGVDLVPYSDRKSTPNCTCSEHSKLCDTYDETLPVNLTEKEFEIVKNLKTRLPNRHWFVRHRRTRKECRCWVEVIEMIVSISWNDQVFERSYQLGTRVGQGNSFAPPPPPF